MDPSLGRFLSPDSIVPTGTQGTQAWDRYGFVNNNPVRYNDPTGHQIDQGEGGDYTWQDQFHDAVLQKQNNQILCKAGNAEYCSGWSNYRSRRISGIHFGFSVITDMALGAYKYAQTDYLFDWKSGTFYKTETSGSGYYTGTPNGISGEGYVGTSNVQGIPSSATPKQVNDLLAGENIDIAGDLGLDLGGFDGTAGSGYSIDLEPDTGTPQISAAGPLVTTERKIGAGLSIIPLPVSGGLQWGRSQTTSTILYQISWWPFK